MRIFIKKVLAAVEAFSRISCKRKKSQKC